MTSIEDNTPTPFITINSETCTKCTTANSYTCHIIYNIEMQERKISKFVKKKKKNKVLLKGKFMRQFPSIPQINHYTSLQLLVVPS